MENIHVALKNVLYGMVKSFQNKTLANQYNYPLFATDFDSFGSKVFALIEKYEGVGVGNVTKKMLENENINLEEFQHYFKDCDNEENFLLYLQEVQAYKFKLVFEEWHNKIGKLATKIQGTDSFKKADDFVSVIHNQVNQLKPLKKGREGFTMVDLHKEFKNLQGKTKPIPSGFKEVDDVMGGWKRSGINILTGPSNHGKSTVAFNSILNAILKGNKVLLLNLELGKNDVYSKMMSLVSKQASKEHHQDYYDFSDAVQMEQHEEQAKADSIFINEFYKDKLVVKTGTFTDEMVYQELYEAESLGFDLVIVDYFQLIEVGAEGKNRTAKLSELQEKVRNIVRNSSFAFVWLAQLKEDTSKDQDGNLKTHPMEYEITWCRDLYKGADLELRIWREYENIQTKTFTDFIYFGFTKSRSFGRVEPIKMVFDGARGFIGEEKKLKTLAELLRENPHAEDEFYDDYSEAPIYSKEETDYNMIDVLRRKSKEEQERMEREEENIKEYYAKQMKELDEIDFELDNIF